MRSEIDYSFDYRSLDNEKPYKDGMTHQEYYLYYWGCEKPGIKETKWEANQDWYEKNSVWKVSDEIEVSVIEPIKIKSIENWNESDELLEFKTIKYKRAGYSFTAWQIDDIRRAHPIPDKLMTGVVAILFGRGMQELEDPLSALMHSNYLDYLKFEKTLPLELRYEEHSGLYILRGWMKKL